MSNFESNVKYNFSNIVFALFVFCLTITLALISFNREKEIDTRKTLALSLSTEHDPIAEYLFSQIEDELLHDRDLINLIARNPYDVKTISSFLKNKYFYDYWAKYDLQITVCAPYEQLLIKPSNIQVDCTDFFNDYINEVGKTTISKNLIFLNNNTGSSSYISIIPIDLVFVKEWEANKYYVYLEFDSKFVPRDLGFPELLLDEGIETPGYLSKYSYAIFKNGLLINKFGSFFYSINLDDYGEFKEGFSVFNLDSYKHLIFNKDDNTTLIVSKPGESVLEKIAPFSYLFILYFLLLLIYWTATNDIKLIILFNINFKKRLQASMILIVLISLISIVSVSAWFIYNIYTNKNKSFLNEKAYSVLTELEYQMMETPIFSNGYDYYINDLLLRMSNVYFTDINIYSTDGKLIGSSRPSVFDEGLISELMNPYALLQLRGHKRILHIHHEKIGNLQYLSAYMPLRDQNNELIAYINLPYFAKHGELRSEISHFLVAFINIYLLLLVLAIMIALLISNYVTKPLQLLRNSISSIKLVGVNKKIEWEKNDEIGQLVKEYNRMIDELATSAELLAQNERESAWREMAKQVAHEIKNPLTPMKLSVQYLEKAWHDKVPDWDDRLKSFTSSIVEQIDNMSEIASAFSDFAKMPAGKFEKMDLKKFVEEAVKLYNDFEKLKLNIIVKTENDLIVYADKKQLLRIFNNLIKNAIQAYDKSKVKNIDIILFHENGNNCIEVKDYGSGIDDDFKKNIFKPYFTTKTGGLGLGLAMVKNIVEGFGGTVGFNSVKSEGASFFIRIPKA